MRRVKRSVLWVVVFLSIHQLTAQWVEHHNALFEGTLDQPEVGRSFVDPHFHTIVTRITNARDLSIAGLIPIYSQRQAWNADESKLILKTTENAYRLYNGKNYSYIKSIDISGSDQMWSHKDPDIVYFTRADSILYAYNVLTDEQRIVHAFVQYPETWNYEEAGSLSYGDSIIALTARDHQGTAIGLFTYDLVHDVVKSTMEVHSSDPVPKSVLTSPYGDYVVVGAAAPERGFRVFDSNFKLLWEQKSVPNSFDGPGECDIGLDSNGEEVFVCDFYEDTTYVLRKYRLSDGKQKELLRWPLLEAHYSLRQYERPLGGSMQAKGWLFVSMFSREVSDSTTWQLFQDEIFALKLDGSGEIRRVVHMRDSVLHQGSTGGVEGYYTEPHATVNRSGNRILYSSNWKKNVNDASSLDSYVVDFSSLPSLSTVDDGGEPNMLTLDPMPADNTLRLDFSRILYIHSVEIRDVTGKRCEKVRLTSLNPIGLTLDTSECTNGVYSVSLMTSSGIQHYPFVVHH